MAAGGPLEGLDALLGEWTVAVPGIAEKGTATFEWLEGGGFLIWRSTIDRPEFPNGISIIGATAADGGLQQHYFDSRGVARVFEMSLEDGIWTLWREGPDWPQRYVGEFSDDGNTISGAWERGESLGAPLQHDFDLNYTRLR